MTTALSSSQAASDPWDQPEPSSSQARATTAKSVAAVRDDWEDEEEEEEDGTTDGNQKIWEEANAKSSNPMPSVVIAPSATSTYKVLSPPPEAFQPAMRILKRPSGQSKSPTPPPTSASNESLQEREAKYQAARDRIFGQGSPSPGGANDKDNKKPTSPGVTITRNPRGPSDGSAPGSAGFHIRSRDSNDTKGQQP